MLVTICDKCGKRIEENKGRFFFDMDFCLGCTEELQRVVQSWIDEPKSARECLDKMGESFEAILDSVDEGKSFNRIEIPKEVKEQIVEAQPIKINKKIDWNKACALKLAGWSNHDIARELRVNEGTINACIYKRLEVYKAGGKA